MPAPRVILCVSHTAEWGGAEAVLADLWSVLDRERFTPHLVCPGDGPLCERARQADVPVHALPLVNTTPLRKALAIPGGARALRRLAAELGAGLLHANTMIAGYAAVLAGRRRLPVLWHLHVLTRSAVARTFLRRADLVVVPSQAAAGALPNAVVVPNGVPAACLEMTPADALQARAELRTRLGLGDEAPLIGIVARLDPHKGHDVFLQAAARLVGDGSAAHFVVAGGPAFAGGQARVRGYEERLRGQVLELGLDGRVHWLGHVAAPAELLAGLDAVAVPSVAPEAAPRGVTEAMAVGCPVVASRIGGIPELLRDGAEGLLVAPGDAPALATALAALLGRPAVTAGMRAAARRRAEAEWSPGAFGARMAEVYARAMR